MKRYLILLLLLVVPGIAFSATRYAVGSGGVSSGTCPIGTPCTLTYAISGSTAGDTIILNSGTYTGTYTVNKALTITTTPEVISGLGTFTKGIPSGTDNRPYFAGTSEGIFDITAANVTISYMKIRVYSTPRDVAGESSGGITVSAYPAQIDHTEVYNGGHLVTIGVKRDVLISQCYIHDTGGYSPYPFTGRTYGNSQDTHAIVITGNDNSTAATTWTNGIRITASTISGAGGNNIQANGNCYYGTGAITYLQVDNSTLSNCYKQNFDMKGSNYIRFNNNLSYYDASASACYGHMTANSPSDCNSVSNQNWEVYNNIFYGCNNYVFSWTQNGSGVCSAITTYNNLMYRTNLSPDYDIPAWKMCNGSTFFSNTLAYNGNGVAAAGLETCNSGNNVKNNIFYYNGNGTATYGNIGTHQYGCTNSGTPSYNYVYPSAGTTGTNAITTSDPGFTNAAGNIYTLTTASVNKDSGTALGGIYATDILGGTRPYGAAYDRGAYEYGASAGSVPSTVTGVTITGR